MLPCGIWVGGVSQKSTAISSLTCFWPGGSMPWQWHGDIYWHLYWCGDTATYSYSCVSGFELIRELYTVEPPLLWTPLGPSKVSCIERCPHFRGDFPLRKHIWDVHSKVSLVQRCLCFGVSFKRGSTVRTTTPCTKRICKLCSTFITTVHHFESVSTALMYIHWRHNKMLADLDSKLWIW